MFNFVSDFGGGFVTQESAAKPRAFPRTSKNLKNDFQVAAEWGVTYWAVAKVPVNPPVEVIAS